MTMTLAWCVQTLEWRVYGSADGTCRPSYGVYGPSHVTLGYSATSRATVLCTVITGLLLTHLYQLSILMLYHHNYAHLYRRPGFNCVVKQLRFWLFKVDCEFKDCDLRVLRIGHTCVIYTLRSNNCELREKSQFAIFKLRN